ncbi:hypothetical protein O5290_27355 [Escherichia coli]|nr:hypothetical protein [Escherichia coli]
MNTYIRNHFKEPAEHLSNIKGIGVMTTAVLVACHAQTADHPECDTQKEQRNVMNPAIRLLHNFVGQDS